MQPIFKIKKISTKRIKINILIMTIFIIFSLNQNSYTLLLKSKSKVQVQEKTLLNLNNKANLNKEKDADETTIPIINVHLEEADRDPLEVKRFEDERHLEKIRVKSLEEEENQDARIFQQILSNQNTNLGTLMQLEHSSANLLKKISSEFK